MLMSKESLITLPICWSFKIISLKYDFIHILNDIILYIYIAPGQGQTTLWGQNFDVNRNSLSLCSFVASLKKISLTSDFLPFFMCVFSLYIAPGRGRQPIGTEILWQQEGLFSFLILYTFLMILYMYIAPGQGQNAHWGQIFYVNKKPLPLWPFVASFKQISLNSDFIHIF